MITKDNVEFYFNSLKKRNIIADISQWFGYNDDSDYITIRFTISNRRSSYRIKKSEILEYIRNYKIEQIINQNQ
jgi:hypothetical protein